MNVTKMTIHAGHAPAGMQGCGCSGYLNESEENRKVVEALSRRIYTQDLSYNSGASQKTILRNLASLIDEYDVPDLSIHLNAFNGNAHGTRVYISSDLMNNNHWSSWAKGLCTAVSNSLGTKDGGVFVNDSLYLFKHCQQPVVILECCFVDNLTDASLWDPVKCADAVADYMHKTGYGAKLELVNNEQPEITEQEDDSISGVFYTVQTGAFRSKDNAYKHAYELKKAGFKCFVKKS